MPSIRIYYYTTSTFHIEAHELFAFVDLKVLGSFRSLLSSLEDREDWQQSFAEENPFYAS